MPRHVSTEELLQATAQAVRESVWTALPGTVEAYRSTEVVADIVPGLTVPVETTEGGLEFEALPLLPSVPVLFPGASTSGVKMTWPLVKGDTGLLLVATYSFQRWREAGKTSDPSDVRLHHLANCLFLPGFATKSGLPSSATLPGLVLEHSDIRLGETSTLHVALAERVEARLAAIEAFLLALEISTVTGLPVTTFAPDTSVIAATKVKAE